MIIVAINVPFPHVLYPDIMTPPGWFLLPQRAPAISQVVNCIGSIGSRNYRFVKISNELIKILQKLENCCTRGEKNELFWRNVKNKTRNKYCWMPVVSGIAASTRVGRDVRPTFTAPACRAAQNRCHICPPPTVRKRAAYARSAAPICWASFDASNLWLAVASGASSSLEQDTLPPPRGAWRETEVELVLWSS